MALINNQGGSVIYLKVSSGQIIKKNKDKSIETYTEISGTIIDVKYEMDSYKDSTFEMAKIYMRDGNETYCLQMRTESGYFRGLCNSLKSGDIQKTVLLKPHIDKEGSKTTIFVKQDGDWLKHFHPKDNLGDCPEVKIVVFKGKEEKDGTEQTEFFKRWLISQNWGGQKDKTIKDVVKERNNFDDEIPDDLPF